MLKVYGTPICKDCLAMKIIFGKLKVDYEFTNITGKSLDLHAFIIMRDTDPAFENCRKNGAIGIPCFEKDGKKTFDINEALSWEGFDPVPEEEINRITEECVLACR